MNLLDFFNPITYKDNYQGILPFEDTLACQITHPLDGFNLNDCDLVIIGIEDSTNSPSNLGCKDSPNAIRNQLRQLVKTSRDLNIVDLGNIKGKTINDRYFAIREVTRELLRSNVTILFIGGGQDYILPFSQAIKERESVSLALIDNKIDFSFTEGDFSSETTLSHLESNLQDEDLKIHVIGAQKYFIGESQKKYFESKSWSISRLKDVVGERVSSAEPYLRDCNLLCFDASAIESAIMPYWNGSNVNGFSGVEACKLAWYGGMSSNVKVFGLTELNIVLDAKGSGVMLYAQAAWHFLEGMSHNNREIPSVESSNYKIFVVHLHEFEVDLRFYNSRLTNRWWVEVPTKGHDLVIACHESDYALASNGELPQKWWRSFMNGSV